MPHVMTDKRTQSLLAATVVLVIAAIMRVYHINLQSIWFDEAFAWNIIVQNDMYPRIAADTHPPLYYVLLRGWTTVAGDTALALRYLSAMISLGTVALVMQVTRELVRSLPDISLCTWGPPLVGLVLALFDAEIFLAQESRNYSLYTFFATFSMWAYLRWLRRPSRFNAGLWTLTTAALVYTHYQGLFIPAVQGLHVLIFLRGRQRVEAIGWLALSGVIFLPWFVGVTVPQAQNAIDNSLPYAIPSNWDTFLYLRDSYLGAQWALMTVLMLPGLWLLIYARKSQRLSWIFLVGLWILVPFCVLFFGNYVQRLLTERKLLIIAPALSILIGLGITYLGRQPRLLVAGAILIYGVSTVDYWRGKEPWDDIAATIVPYVQPTDLTMLEIGVGQYPMKYYWSRMLPEDVYLSTFPFLGDPTMAPNTDWFVYYNALLPEALENAQRDRVRDVATAWFLFWSQEQVNFQRLADAGFVRTKTFPFTLSGNQVDLYRYDHLPADNVTTFDNGMTLRAVELDGARIDLWWSGETVDVDYTTSVKLFDDAGNVVAQLDSPPGDRPTSQWGGDDVFYDGKFPQSINAGVELPAGEYRVTVEVYRWIPEEERIALVPTADGQTLIEIGSVTR